MLVRDIMTPDPLCCMGSTHVIDAARLMQQFDLGFLLVVDEGWAKKLIGVVTDRDLCLSMLSEVHDPNLARVADCMRTHLVTCTPEMDVRQVLAEMMKYRIRRLPVVEQGNYLRGVVGISDLIHNGAVSQQDLWIALSRITAAKTKEGRARPA